MREDGTMSTIQIDVSVRNNTLICGVNGGNVLGIPGDRVVWRSGNNTQNFILEFFRLAAEPAQEPRSDREPMNVSELPRWPFSEPEPKGGVVGPTSEFSGTLKKAGEPAAYKYYVTVGNLRLDPVVIVDR
jgi:hypothetical protein